MFIKIDMSCTISNKTLYLIAYYLCYYSFKISVFTLPGLPLCVARIANRPLDNLAVYTEQELVIYISSSYFNKCNAG
jgi:hypothetical protein